MKLLFCSLSNRSKLSSKIYEHNSQYYSKYGFDFTYEDKSLCDDRHIAWSKILLLQRCLEQDYDYVIWIDDDILIMNHDIDFRDIINKYNPETIMVDDNNNLSRWNINTGMIVCKRNEKTKSMLKEVWENAKHEHYFGGVWENDTMNEYRDQYTIIPHRTIQSFTRFYKIDDFSIHFAGLDSDVRIKLRDEYINSFKNKSMLK